MNRKDVIDKLVEITGEKKTRLSLQIYGNKSALFQKDFGLVKIIDFCLREGISFDELIGLNLAARKEDQINSGRKKMELMKRSLERILFEANKLMEDLKELEDKGSHPQLNLPKLGG